MRKTSSSDLAEKITELKEALAISRLNSYKTRRLSGETITKAKVLQRTVSMDEVNNLRRTSEEPRFPLKDSKYMRNELRQDQEKENEPVRNLRRSVSENALHASPQNAVEHSSPFLPFTRRFSQRIVKEQEPACDLVMENPTTLEAVSSNKEQQQRNISSHDDKDVADISKSDSLSTKKYPDRHEVRSPREAVLEEADQLSSVLGNILDTLGSSTDSERESESEKEAKKEPEKVKVQTKTIADLHKDDELEALCETLDQIIQDNSSDSTSESGNDNITNGKRYNLRQAKGNKSAFKPPIHPTRRTTQQLGKTKSLDSAENSKRNSITNGRSNHERVTKAKSVDVAPLTRNRRPQERNAETLQNISNTAPKKVVKTIPKKEPDRRQSAVKTRAQRQRELNNSSLSETTNRKQNVSNNRESAAGAKQPVVRRGAVKAKSVDKERPRARPLATKSKSADHQENGIKTMGMNQPKTRSGRSSSSEDDKKLPRIRNTEKTLIQPARYSCGKGKSRLSLESNPKGRKSFTKENKTSKALAPSKRLNESTLTIGNSAPSLVEHSVVSEGDTVTSDVVPAIEKTLVVPDHNETDSYSEPVENIKAESVEENRKKSASCEFENENQGNRNLPKEPYESGEILAENNDEMVKLSKEIQSHYSENSVQPNGDVDEGKEETKEGDFTKVKQRFPNESEIRDFVQKDDQPLPVDTEICSDKADSHINEDENAIVRGEIEEVECTQSQPNNRKMTLLDIGKMQSKERLARKEVVSLSLEERKHLILEAAVTKPKTKPANKRRSILQIKNRSDGNLVKSKKEAFEKPDETHTASNGSIEKPLAKLRHFRFRGRRKKSFELSNEQLDIVPEDHEEELEEDINGIVPTTQAQDTRLHSGFTLTPKSGGAKIEKNAGKEKGRSPVKISPLQLPFTKRRGSYDLEKRTSTGSVESLEQYVGEF